MSNYIEKIKSMIWSHSRVMAYVSCPYMFYLKYILEDEGQYIAEGNYYAEAGSYVHEILEKIFNNELSVDDASQYYVDNYDDNIFYKVKQSTMDNTFELCIDYLVNLNLDWLKDYKILGVEKELEINLEGYKFTGFIDLLLEHKDTGEIHVVDHKSSAYPFKKDGKSLLKKAEKDFEVKVIALKDGKIEYKSDGVTLYF